MKTAIALFVYAIASGLIGLIACGIALRFKWKRVALIFAVFFFGGPLVAFVTIEIRDTQRQDDFEAARKEVQELCARNGGDKIYKTIDNVEGVFQMKARNPEQVKQWQDQYGMVDPWGAAMGDFMDVPISISTHGRGYLFIEQQPGFDKPEGPPYRRTYLSLTGHKNGDKYPYGDYKDDPEFQTKEIEVKTLLSRYGYFIEELTTIEMRKHWIAGGRIKVVDLQTKEVLAERTGYFRAAGPAYLDKWSGAAAQQNGRMCPSEGNLGGFLRAVLKPVVALPSTQQLEAFKGE